MELGPGRGRSQRKLLVVSFGGSGPRLAATKKDAGLSQRGVPARQDKARRYEIGNGKSGRDPDPVETGCIVPLQG